MESPSQQFYDRRCEWRRRAAEFLSCERELWESIQRGTTDAGEHGAAREVELTVVPPVILSANRTGVEAPAEDAPGSVIDHAALALAGFDGASTPPM